MSFLEKVLAIIGKVVSDQRQSEWQTVERKDIHVGGQDYIHIVQNWRSKSTLETLKLHAESKGYSGFSLGRDGTWAANKVFFKKVDYQLTSSRVTANPAADCIWIRVPVGQEAPSQAGHDQNNDTAKMVLPKAPSHHLQMRPNRCY